MAPTDAVISERLVLPLFTAEILECYLAGDVPAAESAIGVRLPPWVGEEAGLMRLRLRQIREEPGSEPWLLRPIALRGAEPVTIGLFNFHGPPDDLGFAEIGYGLDPTYWGQGYAIEAVRAMLDWAAAEYGVHRFRASISPDNTRSANLVAKLGMTRVGAQWDTYDGLELLYTVRGWRET